MATCIPTLPLLLGALLILTAAPRAWTAHLPLTPAVQGEPSEQQCAELAQHPAIIRRQKKAWQTPFDATTGEAALRDWDTACRVYQQRHHLWVDEDAKARAVSDAAWERSERRSHSRIDCRSTWHHGPYSSQLTTTCHTY